MQTRDLLSTVQSSLEFKKEEIEAAIEFLNKYHRPDASTLGDIIRQFGLKWVLAPIKLAEGEGYIAQFRLDQIPDPLLKGLMNNISETYFKNTFGMENVAYQKYGWFYFKDMRFLINLCNLNKIYKLCDFLNKDEHYAQPTFDTNCGDRALPWYVEKVSPKQYQLTMFSSYSNPINDRLLLSQFKDCITMHDDGSHFIHDTEELERLSKQKNRLGR